MFKVLQFSDLHFDDFLTEKFGLNTRANFESLLEAVPPGSVDHLFISGDLGLPGSLAWLSELLKKKEVPYSICLGNHDSYDAILSSDLDLEHSASSSEYYYSSYLNGYQLIVLDTGTGKISDEQKSWFQEQVNRESSHLLLLCHYPLLDVDPMLEKYLGHSDRFVLRNILEKSKRKVSIFCGHFHSASFRSDGTVQQFVSPAVIMQIDSNGRELISKSFDFGYQEILFGENAVQLKRHFIVSERQVEPGE